MNSQSDSATILFHITTIVVLLALTPALRAADNSWGDWTEFNKMIPSGGWGDRSEKDGPFVCDNNEGKIVSEMSSGKAGKHAPADAK